VNGKKVNIPSYQVKAGDVVEVKEKSKQMTMVLEAMQSPERDVPEYIEFDTKAVKGTFLRKPSFTEIPYPVKMEPNLVIEFYSR
jgi:small subunit ribosomal protein S4